ncbi:MAG TPA: response regulator, partial [Gemmataceae bacterium]|nr:response regulator [Gemmataceae bacterium]
MARTGKMLVNVLLVGDQPAKLLALETILDSESYRLIRAGFGHEAVRRLEGDDFAVILLDVQLSGLDGLQTARLIRACERSRHTPIIFISGTESAAFSPAEADTLGHVDYLVKPVIPAVLRAKVKVFVELFRLTRHVKKHVRVEEDLKEASRRKDGFLTMLG